MIKFPTSTVVDRILPKEAFYKHLNLSNDLKEKFISDVKRIRLENSLTANTLHLKPGTEIEEILIISIELKKKDFNNKIIETIARQNKHKIVFLLRFEDQAQLALYYSKLYKTTWETMEKVELEGRGFNLDEIWNSLIEQIAIQEESILICNVPIEERLKQQEANLKLQKEIEKLEKMARSEKQPKKKFELAMKVQHLIKELNNQSN